MPFSNKGRRKETREKELRVSNQIYENYRNIDTLRSRGFNVPCPAKPQRWPYIMRGRYALNSREMLQYDALHCETLPLNPFAGSTV